MSGKFTSHENAKIKALIIAKLLQHDEPIYASDIADYINGHRFGISAEVTPQDIGQAIRKYGSGRYYLNQINIIKNYKGQKHAYYIVER